VHTKSRAGSHKRQKGRRANSPPKNTSWSPGRKGQGGEGYSKGYGGSAGPGTGPSGPEEGSARPARHRRPSKDK
jgi:hypothetical protein